MPGLIFGAILAAIGAILRYAVTDRVEDFDLSAIGLILLIVGIVICLVSFLLFNPWRSRVRVEQVEDEHGRGYRRVEKTHDATV